MKKSLFISFITIFFFWSLPAFSQKNKERPLDSALEANSEKWKVKEHKGLFGLAKPQFGPYTTLAAEKLDSPVIRKRRKDSSGIGASVSGAGWDWDIRKYKTFEKKKFYRMALGKESDTIELQFFIHSVSAEKQQTVLGKMLSKNDEGKDARLAYLKNIEGVIFTGAEQSVAGFFIEDYVSSKQITRRNALQKDSITRGYILIKNDSLFTEPVMHTFGNPKDKFFMEWQTGIFMNDANGTHVAALRFVMGQPFYIWIRKDLKPANQQVIAAFFAVIVSVKNL